MNLNHIWISLVVVTFALTITVSLASADYVVIKDVNGICRVIASTHKTPKTMEGGGPFKTKEEAVKVKEQKCASAKTPAKEKEPGILEKIKEKAQEKEGAKQELKQKSEKAKQELKDKQEKAKQELGEKQAKVKKDKQEKAKQRAKEKEEKAKDKAK